MRKNYWLVLAFAILILFIIQATGTLVESIYILDLMTSGLDAKVLGVLFFFAPLIALPFMKRNPRLLLWVLFGLLLVSRGVTPYLGTTGRLLSAGIATAASFSLFFLLVTSIFPVSQVASSGLALAVALSSLVRTLGHGVELSLTPAGGWIGWLLGLLLGGCLVLAGPGPDGSYEKSGRGSTGSILGLYLVMTLVYFSISAPSVIARWTEGDYTVIVGVVSLLSLAWAWLSTQRPGLFERISARLLLPWNLLFTICLTLTLLAQRVPFPATLQSLPVVVGGPTLWQLLPMGMFLLLFPVLFLDFQVFTQRLQAPAQKSTSLAPGILLGSFLLILLVFVNIFSNVWGYIRPISPYFRNTFWLAYFILAAAISLLAWRFSSRKPVTTEAPAGSSSWLWPALLGALFIVTVIFALPTSRVGLDAAGITSLRLMTMNTQQSNDANAQKSFTEQLMLIEQVNPDILALQETDSTRISLNNNDYVRYFADHLGYYSYYGPRTPTGTYGTAILSRYPLSNAQTVFMFSDKDETGVAEAQVEVAGLTFTIYDVHPDSSDPAMLAFAQTLIDVSRDKPYVIAMGDYNLRDYEPAYQLLDGTFTNAWTSVYPSEVSTSGLDMSGEDRIDHIFLSSNLTAVNPTYILPPDSHTDHPVHWTGIVWNNP